jgi:Family of unknown function (DUF6931)
LTNLEIAKAAGLSGEAMPLVRDDQKPQECAETLAEKGMFADAISLIAYAREPVRAIAWGRDCVKQLPPPEPPKTPDHSLAAVEAWLEAPDEDKRRAAQAAAEESGDSKASDLLALAVFFSGGSIADPDAPPADPPPFVTNKLVAGCVQLASVGFAPEQNAERFRTAIRLAKG